MDYYSVLECDDSIAMLLFFSMDGEKGEVSQHLLGFVFIRFSSVLFPALLGIADISHGLAILHCMPPFLIVLQSPTEEFPIACGPSERQCLPFMTVSQGPEPCSPQVFAAMGQGYNCQQNAGVNLHHCGRLEA